jgi:hypothetical protein
MDNLAVTGSFHGSSFLNLYVGTHSTKRGVLLEVFGYRPDADSNGRMGRQRPSSYVFERYREAFGAYAWPIGSK